MSVFFNAGTVNAVQFSSNGGSTYSTVSDVYYNGVLVFGGVQTTVTPDITYTFDPGRSRYFISVFNRDPSGAASIWSEVNDSTPDILRSSSVAYNSSVTWIFTSSFPGFTIYATAQVPGENLSAVRSVYVS
jgi:hypothetical protein